MQADDSAFHINPVADNRPTLDPESPMPLQHTLIALALVPLGPALLFAALRLPTAPRLATYWAITSAMVAIPLLIPLPHTGLRLIVAIPIAATVFKMFDLAVAASTPRKPGTPHPTRPGDFVAFLLASPSRLTFDRWANPTRTTPGTPPRSAAIPPLTRRHARLRPRLRRPLLRQRAVRRPLLRQPLTLLHGRPNLPPRLSPVHVLPSECSTDDGRGHAL